MKFHILLFIWHDDANPNICYISAVDIYIYISDCHWPARESRRSLNIALDFYVWRSVRLAQSAVW